MKRYLFGLLILMLICIHFFVPRLISEIGNPVVTLIKRNKNVDVKLSSDQEKEYQHKALLIKSFDNIQLAATLTYSHLDSVKGTVILLHGIRSNKDHFKEVSKFLAINGYNSVALDLRAHGESGGQFCSFGVNEKKDIQKLVDFLIDTEKLNHIGIWGQSLGGAVGLQAMGIDSRLQFGIIESTFTDLKTVVNDYFDLYIGFSFTPFSNYLVNRTGDIADFDPNEASPIRYCNKINKPILIVHGDQDKRINIKYGRDNFLKISSKEKEFLEIENATHSNVWEVGGQEYFIKILSFLDNQQLSNTAKE